MIRIDSLWLAVEPTDMRAGADRLLASVVRVFGAAQAHHGDLFANARASRMKLLVHDSFGVWCANRRLNLGGFEWQRQGSRHATVDGPHDGPHKASTMATTRDQFDALVLGLPWQRLAQMRSITWL